MCVCVCSSDLMLIGGMYAVDRCAALPKCCSLLFCDCLLIFSKEIRSHTLKHTWLIAWTEHLGIAHLCKSMISKKMLNKQPNVGRKTRRVYFGDDLVVSVGDI